MAGPRREMGAVTEKLDLFGVRYGKNISNLLSSVFEISFPATLVRNFLQFDVLFSRTEFLVFSEAFSPPRSRYTFDYI